MILRDTCCLNTIKKNFFWFSLLLKKHQELTVLTEVAVNLHISSCYQRANPVDAFVTVFFIFFNHMAIDEKSDYEYLSNRKENSTLLVRLSSESLS